MKKLSILATLLVLLAVAVVPVLAITGGEEDGEAHPNVGAIVGYREDMGPFVWCSGTLIAPNVFLTAGHCTYDMEYWMGMGVQIHVSFDADNALQEGWRDVSEVHTHPGFLWILSNPYDLGALILQEPIPGDEITPAVLPAENYLDVLNTEGLLKHGKERAIFTVVGYGATVDWPPPVATPGDGVRRVAWSEFLNLRKAWLHMSQNMAPGKGDSGSCYGDSGGPIFWTEANGDQVLVAVTSWGDVPCIATGTTYRVDIPSSLAFIESLID